MLRIIVLSLLLASPALAQESPDDLKRAISVLQLQRNQALDGQAVSEVRAQGLKEQLDKAQARVKELEAQTTPPKKKEE